MKRRIYALIRAIVKMAGLSLKRRCTIFGESYDQDGLYSVHNHDFMKDPSFCRAYERGVAASGDHHWHWRVHIGLWAAVTAAKLEGDFVECGVNRGFLSSAIMEHLNWDTLTKTFYLLDTFDGLSDDHLLPEEAAIRNKTKRKWEAATYVHGVESVKKNFSQWKNVRIIQGTVPETLPLVESEKIAYLHIDMNCMYPETQTLRFFWNRIVPGGIVLLDDYAYCGCLPQKKGMDAVAEELSFPIASIPTGQGLIIKTPD
jgi:hypothetical protein